MDVAGRPGGAGALDASRVVRATSDRGIRYEVEAVDEPARIVVQSSLVANEPGPERPDDPARRRAAGAARRRVPHAPRSRGRARASDARSGLRLAAGLDHVVEGPDRDGDRAESEPDLARVTVSTELAPGQTLGREAARVRMVEPAFDASAARSGRCCAVRGRRTGWDGSWPAQRAYLDEVWDRADVEVEGDPSCNRRCGSRSSRSCRPPPGRTACDPAKGLTGSRLRRAHVLGHGDLHLAGADLLRAAGRPRHPALAPLDAGARRARARELRLEGAAFPWRTIRGEECSGYWPAGTAALPHQR